MSEKQRLLNDEDAGWHELCSRLDRLSDDDWLKPGVNDDWSAKDLLAHIAAWHALSTDRLEVLRSSGTLPQGPDVEEFNHEQHDLSRNLTLREVRAMSGAARHRFREEVALLGDEPGADLRRLVYGNADGHYLEHVAGLDAFLESR